MSVSVHQKMLEAFPDLYFVINKDGFYVSAFSSADGMKEFLVDPRHIIGHNMSDFLPPDVATQCKDLLKRTFETQKSQSLEYALDIQGVGKQYYEARSVPMEHGEIAVVCRNISRRQNLLNRERFLSHATQLLSSSLDYHFTLRTLLNLIVPELADYAVIRILDPSGKIERVEAVCKHPEKESIMHEILARYSWNKNVKHSGAVAIKTRRSILIKKVDEAYLREISTDEDQFSLVKKLSPTSAISVPLILDDQVMGSINVAFVTDKQKFSEKDMSLFEELAGQAVMAIDRARSHDDLLRAVQLKNNVLSITCQGIEGPFKKIDAELTKLMTLVSSVEDSRLRKEIMNSTKAILRANEEIGAQLEEVVEANEFWGNKKNLEKSPQSFVRLLESSLASNARSAERKSIRFEAKFDETELSVLCNPDEMGVALKEWISVLVDRMPENTSLNLRLKHEGEKLLFSTELPRSSVTDAALDQKRHKLGSLGAEISDQSLDGKTEVAVFAFRIFSPN